jgi:hypothetical protein
MANAMRTSTLETLGLETPRRFPKLKLLAGPADSRIQCESGAVPIGQAGWPGAAARAVVRNLPLFVAFPLLGLLLASWLLPYQAGTRTTVIRAERVSVHVKRPLRLRVGKTGALVVALPTGRGVHDRLAELHLHHAPCVRAVDDGVSTEGGAHRRSWTVRAARSGRCVLNVELSPALAAAWEWPTRHVPAASVRAEPNLLRVEMDIVGVTGLPPLEQAAALAGGLATAVCVVAGRAIRRRNGVRATA